MGAFNRKPFFRGAFMLISFAILFFIMLLPIMPGPAGERVTGLQYADAVFNGLSKGSSYFIPEARGTAVAMEGKTVNLTARLSNPDQAVLAAEVLGKAGLDVKRRENVLDFTGDLGAALKAAVNDSDLLYNNNGEAISRRYNGANPLAVASAWWHTLNPAIHQLQKQDQNLEAGAVREVIQRAIEPGNNFYGIKSEKVSANIVLIIALMLFYVCYTIWYGFGIYEIFEGLGMMGKKQ